MAKPGSKPSSPAEKASRGNPGGRPLSEVPELDKLLTLAPSWLDAAAAGIWNRLALQLDEKDMLADLDRDLLGAYCQHLANAIAAQMVINEKGLTTDEGKKRPEVLIMGDSFEKARHTFAELGLTPSQRFRGVWSGNSDKKREKELSAKYGIAT